MDTLRDFLCIPIPNPGQLNPLFHAFAEFRLIVNRVVAWQSTDWSAANAQFSPNDDTINNFDDSVIVQWNKDIKIEHLLDKHLILTFNPRQQFSDSILNATCDYGFYVLEFSQVVS